MPLTPVEQAEVDAANASGKTPVVFIHGLWLLSSSWQPWRELFEAEGYATLAPGWPDDPETVEAARADEGAFAGKMVQQVTDHYAEAIDQLTGPPVLIGHSFGGMIAQKLAGKGKADVTVAIDPAQFKGGDRAATVGTQVGGPGAVAFQPHRPRRDPDL